MRHLSFSHILVVAMAVTLSACQTVDQSVVLSTKSALELRNAQSRIFETDDQNKVYRSVIAVMQDLGYSINTVEPEAGVVTGNKLAQLDLTATVSERNPQSVRVRANAVVRVRFQGRPHQVDSPEFYQTRFFEPLSKALFLDALLDEDPIEEPESSEQASNTAVSTDNKNDKN